MGDNKVIYVSLGILILGFILYKRLGSFGSGVKDAFETKEEELTPEEKAEIQLRITTGESPTLSDAKARSIASGLKKAMIGWGTNEEMIFRLIPSIKNSTDWLLVYDRYGIVDGMRLDQHLIDELTTGELAKVNGYLSQANIRI